MISITYLGGPETGNVEKLDWGGLTFEKDKAFKVDYRGKNAERKALLKHIVHKARTNRFFKVDGEDDEKDRPVELVKPSASVTEPHVAVHQPVLKPGEPVLITPVPKPGEPVSVSPVGGAKP